MLPLDIEKPSSVNGTIMHSKPIIHLFEENELNIAALYSLYAQKLPENSSFWSRLSDEEIKHAAHIGDSKQPGEQACSIVENKFSRSVIHYVMDFVLVEIGKAQKEEISHREALHTALRVERSLLEKKCFDMFTPASKTIKDLFHKLNSDTERHIEVLLKELKRNKWPLAE